MNTWSLPHAALCLSVLWLTACTNWIDKTGRVLDVEVVEFDPCRPHVEKPTPPEEAYWHLKEGKSQFQVQKKENKAHGIKRIKPDTEDQDIEVPDYYVLNKLKARLSTPACENKESLRNFPFAFAMHMMKDPHDANGEETPHGLLLVPANIPTADPKANPHQFYMLVYDFEADAHACTGQYPDRCKALAELWNMRQTSTVAEMEKAILDRIDIIRPINPSDEINVRYHNGVIHGNL